MSFVLICEVPFFEKVGVYEISYSFNGGERFTRTKHLLQVAEDPIITEISPRVVLKNT